MRVLVTGCYGFLGYHFCKRLLEDGYEVYGTDRLVNRVSEKEERVKGLLNYPLFNYVECDISEHINVVRLYRGIYPTHVVHFAAQYSLPHDTDLLTRYVKSNMQGYLNIIENAKLHKVEKFVYASSYIAAPKEQAWSMYSISKLWNENIATMYRGMNLRSVGLRYGSVFGPYCRKDTAVHMLADKIARGKPLNFSGRQLLRTPFLDVIDAVELTYAALMRDVKSPILTLVANDRRYTLPELACLIREVPVSPEDIVDYAHIETLDRELGMRPIYKVKQTLNRFLEWHRSV